MARPYHRHHYHPLVQELGLIVLHDAASHMAGERYLPMHAPVLSSAAAFVSAVALTAAAFVSAVALTAAADVVQVILVAVVQQS